MPIKSFSVDYEAGLLNKGKVIIPVGNYIYPKMWANAYIQITYLDNNSGEKKEKLFFEGLIQDLFIHEEISIMQLDVVSIWHVLNFNTTLDYVAPKRYGLQTIDGQVKIYIGNEDEAVATPDLTSGYKLSERYLNISADKDIDTIDLSDTDSAKLFFIINRTPLAERFAFSFFEDISYQNFILTRSYINRFKLLRKVKESQSLRDEASNLAADQSISLSLGSTVDFDFTREALYKQFLKGTHEIEQANPTQNTSVKPVEGRPNGLAEIERVFGKPGDQSNIVTVTLKAGKNGSDISVQVHKNLAKNMQDMFNEIYAAGLGKHIKQGIMTYCYRKKNTASGPSDQLSTHSWPIAFDINYNGMDKPNGLNQPPSDDQKILAPYFEKYGWYWGIHFKDPMHFQYCTGY